MKDIYILIFLIFLFVIVVIGIFLWNEKRKIKNNTMSVNDYIDVVDINGSIIYTRKLLISILKVVPLSTELLSQSEAKRIINEITKELSTVNERFKFLAISRPLDVGPLLDDYQEKMTYSNSIGRTLLNQEVTSLSKLALNGELAQRQFFIELSVPLKADAKKTLEEKVNKFLSNSTTLQLELLSGKNLIKFPNLINNPSVISLEDADDELSIPTLY